MLSSFCVACKTEGCKLIHCRNFSFMSDSTYRDIIENSANYNTRLCVERKLRMPFLDAQTGID